MTAAEKILRKALVGSNMDSRAWNSVQAGLRDRAFFSSQVAELQVLDAFRTSSAAHAAGATSMSKLRMALRDYMSKGGMTPGDGTIKDLFSKARLDVIVKTNVATARGFVRWQAMNTPGAYAAFPAQRLLRIRQRRRGRDWAARWKAAGDSVGWRGASRDYGTMVALKDSPIWQALGEGAGGFRDCLGNPYPPFAWGSGMGVAGVPRREAVDLGLISDGELREKTAEMERKRDAAEQPGMNDNLRVEDPNGNLYGELRKKFGDQVRRENGEVKWRQEVLRETLFADNFNLKLGVPQENGLLAKLSAQPPLADFAEMLRGRNLTVDQTWRDAKRPNGTTHLAHFFPDPEHPDNIPLTPADVELLPSVWRNPDRVRKLQRDIFEAALDTFDGNIIVAQFKINVNKGGPAPQLWTLYKKGVVGTATPAGGWPNGQSHSGGQVTPATPHSVPQTP
jgi:hypothetical protein